MKILKPFTKWFTNTGAESKTQTKTPSFEYTTSKDIYKSIREREQAEKKRLEKWRKEFKNQRMSNYNNNCTYSTSIGHLPGNITSKAITTTSLADSKITIDGGPNGSMKVDVPLLVNGRDVMKELDEMRDALLLLKRDVDMEARYPRLRELKDEYERALEKYKTFDAIKESK
jgi:hypothetical protein